MSDMYADSTHTRIVKGARVILPVLALGLLSTLFLLARTVNPDDALPFADVDVSERARDQQLTAPRFAGVSRDGTEYSLIADVARPEPTDPRVLWAETVNLHLTDAAGVGAIITSLAGQIDTASRNLILEGNVFIVTSSGYELRAERMEGSLGRLDIRATGGVTGDGPLGTLRADEVSLSEQDGGAQRLLFTGGVDLLYKPPTE
ncbi:MAG: hypothetical protein WBA67_06565 [Jannaschia sp.]